MTTKGSLKKARDYGLEGRKIKGYVQSQREIPRKHLIENRRREAMQLRASGLPLELIGHELHADPSVNTKGAAVPGGYGWKKYAMGEAPLQGHNLVQAVSKDVSKPLQSAQLASEAIRQEALELELYRLDMASSAIWPRVLRGDPRAQEVWLKNSERRSSLLGLDAAMQVELSGTARIEVAAEGAQPVYDENFADRMFDALQQVEAIAEKPELAALPEGDDIITDAEVVDEPEAVDRPALPES